MSNAVDAVVGVFQLIGAVIVLAAEVAEAVDRNSQRKKALQQLAEEKESQLMDRLLRPGWQNRIQLQWFATHTICQRCERFFDTTNPKDHCGSQPFHTFTPVLDNMVRRIVLREYGKPAPELFLPGRPFYRQVREVRPPPPLENDWVLMDEIENDNDAAKAKAVAQGELTPGGPVASAEKSVSVAEPKHQQQSKKQANQKHPVQNQQHAAKSKHATAASSSSTSAVAAPAAVSPPPPAVAVALPAPSAPPMDAESDAVPRSGGFAHNSAELLQLAVMPDGVEPVSEKEAMQSYRRLLSSLTSSLSPAELELLPNLPHPPDVEPGAEDDLAALPHPPSNDPSVAPPPSYAAAVGLPGE